MAIDYNFQYSRVDQFARRSPEAEGGAILDVGRGFANAIKAGAQTHEEWLQLRDERELLQAGTRMEELESVRAAQRENRLYYSGDELDNTDFKGPRYEKDPSGADTPKKIPAWQAEPFIRKRDSTDDLNNSASGISNWELRQRFLAAGRNRIEKSFQGDMQASLVQAKAQMRWEASKELQLMLDNGRHKEAEFFLDESSVFTDEEKTDLSERIAKDSELYGVREILLEPSWGAAEMASAQQMIGYLADDNYKGALNQEERISAIHSLQRGLNAHKSRASTKASFDQITYEMELERQIKSEYPTEYVDEAYLRQEVKNGKLTVPQYETLTRAVISRDVEKEKKLKTLEAYSNIILAGGKVAPTPENIKTNDELYELNISEYMQSLGPGQQPNPMQILNIGLSSARMSGMVPTPVIEEFMAGNNGGPQELLLAARLFNVYQDRVPEALTRVSTSKFDTVASVSARLQLGLPESVAVEGAIKARDATPAEREIFKQEWARYTKGQADKTIGSKMLDSLSTFLANDPMYKASFWGMYGGTGDAPASLPNSDGIPADAVSTYSGLVQAYFFTEGSIAAAEKRAQMDFKRIYTLTNINNPDDAPTQLMAYVPMRDETSIKEMRKAIESEYGQMVPEGERLYVYSDANTLATGKRDPLGAVFSVVSLADDGAVTYLGPWQYDKEAARGGIKLETLRASIREQSENLEADHVSGRSMGLGMVPAGLREQLETSAHITKRDIQTLKSEFAGRLTEKDKEMIERAEKAIQKSKETIKVYGR